MSTERNDGGPAFPISIAAGPAGDIEWGNEGLSLRDWFAGHAMAGISAGYWSNSDLSGCGPTQIAAEAYAQADAMIAARESQP